MGALDDFFAGRTDGFACLLVGGLYLREVVVVEVREGRGIERF